MRRSVVERLLLLICCLGLFLLPLRTAVASRTVRIGYPEAWIDGTNAEMALLRKYTLTYLGEMTKQLDWQYELLPLPYDECLRKLEAGELDMVFPVYEGELPKGKILSSGGHPCYSLLSLYARASDARFASDKELSLEGKVVGILDNDEYKWMFQYYWKMNGWKLNVRSYPSSEQMMAALRRGEIDAVVDSGNHVGREERRLAVFAALEAQFMVQAERKALLEQFQEAVYTLEMVNPRFVTWLEEEYLDSAIQKMTDYTKPEADLIDHHPPLRVLLIKDTPPLIKDQGGIYVDALKAMANDSGLELVFLKVDSKQEAEEYLMRGKADIILSTGKKRDFSQEVYYTNNFWLEEHAVVSLVDSEKDMGGRCTVAILDSFHGLREYIQRHYPQWEIREMGSLAACLDMVLRGHCQFAVVPWEMLNYENSLAVEPRLAIRKDVVVSAPLCMVVSGYCPRQLQTILNKAILRLQDEYIMEIVQRNMASDMSLRSALRYYPLHIAMIVLLFLLFSSSAIFLIYHNRLRSRQNREIQAKNEELERALRDLEHAHEIRDAYKRESETDALTGLLNRTVIEQICWSFLQEESEGTTFAFFIMDLDHFKDVNDQYGHQVGDKILQEFAVKLQQIFRRTDCVGRFGGDEFVVFAPYITDSAVLQRLGDQTRQAAHDLTLPDGRQLLSASIGVSLAPQHGKTYQEIFQAADAALYWVKENGRNGCCIYNSELPSSTREEK